MISTPAQRDPVPEQANIYNTTFWLAYVANVLIVTAHSLTFRFADYVKNLGGNEDLSGRVMSVAVIAAVFFRFFLGQKIDQSGTRRIWLFSTIVFIASCAMFLFLNRLGIGLYLSRILFNGSLAGMLSCSIVNIQNLAPADRRTEIIGSLGSSGFIAMVLGPWIGDLIFRPFHGDSTNMLPFWIMWGSAGIMGVIYLGIVLLITRDEIGQAHSPTPAGHTLLLQHWPGPILWGAVVVGVNFTVISVFLIRFARHIGIEGMGVFFSAYAITAFLFRVGASGIARRVGRHRVVLIGLLGMAVGQFLFLPVDREWKLVFPALFAGFGHALLFPVVVSLGSGAFPLKYRGTGTTLVLGFTELGTIISAPILGAGIVWLDPYGFNAMFIAVGAFTLVVMVYYALTAARQPDVDRFPQDLVDERSRNCMAPFPVVANPSDRIDPERTPDYNAPGADIPAPEPHGTGAIPEPVVCRSPEK